MALIPCPECAHQISDAAHACPSCGYPVAERNLVHTPTEDLRKERVTAGLYSLLFPGAGQFYRGKPRVAAYWLISVTSAHVVAAILSITGTPFVFSIWFSLPSESQIAVSPWFSSPLTGLWVQAACVAAAYSFSLAGWSAALLSFVLPGLGHLLLGRFVRGLLWLMAFGVVTVFGVYAASHPPTQMWISLTVLSFVLWFALLILSALDAKRIEL